MRLMGIDYGEKRIGLAFSDENVNMAFPHSVIENDKNTLKKIKEICEEKNICRIILGQSLNYKGQPNPIMRKIEKFKELLEKELSLPVDYQSEVLTTQEAMRLPERKGREKTDKTDAFAAALILRTYIDKQKMI